MCRNIKSLRSSVPATEEDFHLAALQYVRKVSGYRQPSRANQQVFDQAVVEIAQATSRLLQGLVIREASPIRGDGSRRSPAR
jgi:hypothetical protein